MKRQRPPLEELRKQWKQIEKTQSLDRRRRKLYNRKYRKSIFFIAIWAGRVIFIFGFFIVLFFHSTPSHTRAEIVTGKHIESFQHTSRNGSHRETVIDLETNYGQYTADYGRYAPPDFNIGDTLLIERNMFGKPIYFTMLHWGTKYSMRSGFLIYYIILFITVISLFFNDGLDRSTDKVLLIVWAADIISATAYFLY